LVDYQAALGRFLPFLITGWRPRGSRRVPAARPGGFPRGLGPDAGVPISRI